MHARFGRLQASHNPQHNAAPPASQGAPFPLLSALVPTHSAGRALLLVLYACPHPAAAANCDAGANCDAASWREDDEELRRLSTSPEVLEAVSEDFGGDERMLADGGGRCVALPGPLASP